MAIFPLAALAANPNADKKAVVVSGNARFTVLTDRMIRMEYAPPTDVLIVGNGDEIIFHDKELDQVTNIDYDDIPGTKILTDTIKIDMSAPNRAGIIMPVENENEAEDLLWHGAFSAAWAPRLVSVGI